MTTRPWLEHYDEGVPHTLHPYPNRTLLEYVHEAAIEGPDRTALWFLEGASVTNTRLEEESDAFAAALHALGVTKGDRVALLLPNCPQFVVAQLGAWKAGAVVAPLSVLYTDRGLVEALDRSRPEVIVVLNRFYDRVRQILPSTSLRRVITTGIKDYLRPLARMLYTLLQERKDGERIRLGSRDVRFLDLLEEHRGAATPVVRVLPDDPAILLMSGGTTGRPKAVTGSHRALVMSGIQYRSWLRRIVTEWEATYILPLPLSHSFAQAAVLNQALIGHNPLILVPDPRDIGELLATIERHDPWLFIGGPALYTAILGQPEVRAGNVDLSSIRGYLSGAAPLCEETKRRFEHATGSVIVEGYSLSESMLAATVNPLHGSHKIGSVGMPLPDVEVRIGDPEDPAIELRTGEVGKILMAAPQLMIGYWNDPGATAKTIRTEADGQRWLLTGDLGRMDEDGYLYVVDRKAL